MRKGGSSSRQEELTSLGIPASVNRVSESVTSQQEGTEQGQWLKCSRKFILREWFFPLSKNVQLRMKGNQQNV